MNTETKIKITGYPTKYAGNFNLCFHDQKKEAVGCGYYYTVTCGAMSHTAFRTKKALKVWLNQTGLKMSKRSWGRSVILTGSYVRNLEMMNTKKFYNTYGHLEPFYALDNGDYTIGFIERLDSGNVLHIQNPNMDRPILDYFKVMTHLETGKPLNQIYDRN